MKKNDVNGFPGGLEGKESACNAGDPGSIPGSGRSPGGGNGNPIQYSCLENPMDSRPWWATVHGVVKNQTGLSVYTHTSVYLLKKILNFDTREITFIIQNTHTCSHSYF